jgi:hypothetical protein
MAGTAHVLHAVAERALELGSRFDRIASRLDRIEGEGDELRRMVEEIDRRLLALEGEGR